MAFNDIWHILIFTRLDYYFRYYSAVAHSTFKVQGQSLIVELWELESRINIVRTARIVVQHCVLRISEYPLDNSNVDLLPFIYVTFYWHPNCIISLLHTGISSKISDFCVCCNIVLSSTLWQINYNIIKLKLIELV